MLELSDWDVSKGRTLEKLGDISTKNVEDEMNSVIGSIGCTVKLSSFSSDFIVVSGICLKMKSIVLGKDLSVSDLELEVVIIIE